MAAEKTTRRKQKSTRGEGDGTALRTVNDPRMERRYEPKAAPSAVVSVVVLSVGTVLLGSGFYAQWLRDVVPPVLNPLLGRAVPTGDPLGPHPAAVWLLLAGALALIAIAVFGPRTAKPIRVGDGGVGAEIEANEIERVGWNDVTRILLGGDMLTVESPGTNLSIPVKLHAQAAARVLAEARKRIPSKVEDVDAAALEKPDDAEGEVLPLDAPHVAGARCKATDRLIAFEKDARLCGRCGEVYHKDRVPERCLTCEARLR
jgi:hypothetical protein